MKNRKDCILYAKETAFPVGHENHGKRVAIARGSAHYLEAKSALARLNPSKVNIVSAWFWENVMKEELTLPHNG